MIKFEIFENWKVWHSSPFFRFHRLPVICHTPNDPMGNPIVSVECEVQHCSALIEICPFVFVDLFVSPTSSKSTMRASVCSGQIGHGSIVLVGSEPNEFQNFVICVNCTHRHSRGRSVVSAGFSNFVEVVFFLSDFVLNPLNKFGIAFNQSTISKTARIRFFAERDFKIVLNASAIAPFLPTIFPISP